MSSFQGVLCTGLTVLVVDSRGLYSSFVIHIYRHIVAMFKRKASSLHFTDHSTYLDQVRLIMLNIALVSDAFEKLTF